MGVITAPVLVLNQNYEPLNVCTVRRAFVLVDRGKAEILEGGRGYLHSIAKVFPVPSVIRLIYMIRRPWPQGRITRRDIFLRDRFTCQYCAKSTQELTLDHVVPRHSGGTHEWTNVVTACKSCNHHKAGRTPAQANMRLLHKPKKPSFSYHHILHPFLEQQSGWRKFVPQLDAFR